MYYQRRISMKSLLKLLYVIVAIYIFIMGFDINIDTENREYEYVGYYLNNDHKSKDINIEYEYLEIEFFDQNVYFENPKIFAEQHTGDVLLNKIDYWGDERDIVYNSTNIYKSDETYRKFYFKGVFIIILYILFLILIPILVFIAIWKNNIINKKNAINENIDAFYKKCISLKIHSVDTEEQKEKLLLVAKNFGYTTIEEAIKNYEMGAKRKKEHIEAKKQLKIEEQRKQDLQLKQEIEKLRSEERQQYLREKELTKITGKNKYISIINNNISTSQAEYKEIEKIDAFTPFMKHKKDNWGWIGGIADGIAGPGAGVMAAAEAHERNVNYNNAVDQYNTSLIQNGYDPTKVEEAKRKKLKSIKNRIEKLKKYIIEIDKVIIKDDSIKSDFEKLKFTINGKVIENTLNISLEVAVEVMEPITLLEQDAIIDGSILIEVLDEKNQKIGDAYYNAGDTKTYNLQKAGFNNSKKRKVVGIPCNDKCFDPNEKYHYKITPITIWTIEVC